MPFAVHTAEGEPLRSPAADRTGAGFRLDDPDLADYVILDFDGFDWLEEDEPIVGHPRDPFHRIDVRRSSRRVRIEHEGDGARRVEPAAGCCSRGRSRCRASTCRARTWSPS